MSLSNQQSHLPIYFEHGAAAVEAYLVTSGKEQLVRGLTIERLELRTLKDLIGAGRDAYAMNHAPGAPASIIAPSLLLASVDVKRHEAENPKPPSYPAPARSEASARR